DGSNGQLGGVNVYEYREGAPRYVTTLENKPYCLEPHLGEFRNATAPACSNGALGRLQVTPNGRFLAFATTSRLTSYDNEGFGEVYRFDMNTRRLICASCRTDGGPPLETALASLGGRFITNDGRVFFTTADPLTPTDTNTGLKELKILSYVAFIRAGWD